MNDDRKELGDSRTRKGEKKIRENMEAEKRIEHEGANRVG